MSPSGKGASKRNVEDQVLRDLQLRIEKKKSKGDWVETTVEVEWKKQEGVVSQKLREGRVSR